MTRVLLIEDEAVILKALTRLLERNRYEVTATRDVEQALAAHPLSFDIVLADLRLPGRDGTTIIPLADPVPVVVMTSHASVRSAVEAMRAGASDYIAKPFDHDELLLVLERALGRNLLGARNRALEQDLARAEPAARRIEATSLAPLLDRLCAPDATGRVLHLHGEAGSGREDLARARHARGTHANAPLFVFDASGAASGRSAHLLLGAEGGSPPGGLLRAARGGTLILRHPERLEPALQRALAERLGQLETSESATALHLASVAREPIESLLARGRLDPALATRLADGIHGEVPPLRHRRGDIAVLARRAAEALGRRHAGRPAVLDEQALAALGARDWPGNVVELESAIARAVLLAQADPRTTLCATSDEVLPLSGTLFTNVPPPERILDLDAYFRYAVLLLQETLSETELAARLGMSRKALWERRQRMSLPRPTGLPQNAHHAEKKDE